mgnify:FL=1
MSDSTDYQQEYDKAAAELDAAAKPAITEPAQEVEAPKEVQEVAPPVDELAELRAQLAKTEKMAKDNQAWATRNAQEVAQLRREKEQQQREASRPAILDANPELADAIRHVVSDPAPRQQEQEKQDLWAQTVDKAHPGIFSVDIDPELEKDLVQRLDQLGEAKSNPLEAIRVITEGKLAHAERQIGKRFAAEAAKLAQKSAMSVPGAGRSSAPAPVDAALAEVQRFQNMSDAEFQKEVRRVKGY